MGELVREERRASCRFGLVVALPKNDVVTDGERLSAHRHRRIVRPGSGVHPDLRKVPSKARLHRQKNIRVERLTSRTQDVVNDARGRLGTGPKSRTPQCFEVRVAGTPIGRN
jgi:hypothetical protein